MYRFGGLAEDITARPYAAERLWATSAQLRALSAKLHSAREEERTRIAREIHDQLGSALTSLRWDLEGLGKLWSDSEQGVAPPTFQDKIDAMVRLTDGTINAVRRIASELRPSILDDLGLLEAIDWQAQQFEVKTGIPCRRHGVLDTVDLDQQQSTAVFRIFQEALTNILRHAQASRVDVTTPDTTGEFVLRISDDGQGILENDPCGSHSLGILGMRERAHLVGGRIDISGVEGKGTAVTVRVPLRPPPATTS
jgi:signal transduction histidine kinase